MIIDPGLPNRNVSYSSLKLSLRKMAVANDLAMTLVITLMLMGLNVVGDFVVDGGLKKHLGSLSQGGLKGVLADGACSFLAKDRC